MMDKPRKSKLEMACVTFGVTLVTHDVTRKSIENTTLFYAVTDVTHILRKK